MKRPNLLLSLLAILITFGSIPASSFATTNCTDIEIIFARGSGAPVNTSEDYQAFKAALSEELSSHSTSLSTHFYDLGTSPHGGHKYPAASIENLSTISTALFSGGKAFVFGNSVKEGIAELKSYIDEKGEICSNTKYVLAGYSQGAMVISSALQSIDPNKILYAATFGDPKLYLPEGKKSGPLMKPIACSGSNLSNYRLDVPDCEVESGILGALDPYQLSHYLNKLGAWCNEADFMCGSYFDFKKLGKSGSYEGRNNPFAGLLEAHLSYKTDNSYKDASKVITNAISVAYPNKITIAPAPSVTHQNIAVLLDITGSMSSLIDKYRKETLTIAKTAKSKGNSVAIYTYGDELLENTSPKLLCDASCSLDEITKKLDELVIYGGDDEPESALSALLHVMNTMSWERGANKSIILLTDASYHSTDINGITLNDVVKRSYEIDPVNIFTITPPEIIPEYTDLTSKTGGQTFNSATEIEASTTIVLNRPYVNIGEVNFTNTPPAIIDDHTISYNADSATISLSTSSATAFFLSLNDAPLGLTAEKDFTLTDLHFESILTITPINPDGRPGTPLSLSLSPPSNNPNPNPTPTPTPTPPRNVVNFLPKAPNCGKK